MDALKVTQAKFHILASLVKLSPNDLKELNIKSVEDLHELIENEYGFGNIEKEMFYVLNKIANC